MFQTFQQELRGRKRWTICTLLLFIPTAAATPSPSSGCIGRDYGGIRSIPDFAREADFLRLLPRGAEIDPNDPRHGNVMRMRGLLAALGLERRESHAAVAAGGGGRSGGVLGLAKRAGSISAVVGNAALAGVEEEEDSGVFRASEEQQALVFAGKRVAKGSSAAAAAASRGNGSGGSGAFDTFAYNNHRR